MSNKPDCQCGHSHGQHAWGTSFCSGHDMLPVEGTLIRQPKWCECKQYKEGLCPCGHAWERHGYKDNSRQLTCPVCGKTCALWNVGKGKIVNQSDKPGDVCECGHLRVSHADSGKSKCHMCPVFEQNVMCDTFKPRTSRLLSCKRCIFQASGKNEITHSSACPIYPGGVEVYYEDGHTSITWPDKTTATKGDAIDTHRTTKWQDEVEKEEKEKPECICGHEYNSHYESEEGNLLECAECYEPIDAKNWETTCKNYTPSIKPTQVDLDFSDDPAEINKAALQAIGNTGAMSPEEIQKKIDEWKANCQTNSGTVPKQPIGQTYSDGWHQNYNGVWAKCWHKPTHVIDGDTWGVWAGTKSDCLDSALSYDVLLNVSNGLTVVPKHSIPFAWARKYEETKTKEIVLDWPDQGIPQIDPKFWKDLVAQLQKHKQKMLVFCIGGHGRTGTSIACLLVALGWSAKRAKQQIWTNYCREAIETKAQENYIDAVDKALNGPRKNSKKVAN